MLGREIQRPPLASLNFSPPLQVGEWLWGIGLGQHAGSFAALGMTGPRLLNLDTRELKALNLSPEDKAQLKKKVRRSPCSGGLLADGFS